MERIQETLSQGQEKAPATEKNRTRRRCRPQKECRNGKKHRNGKSMSREGMSAAHGRLRPAATESTGTITVRKTEVNIAVMGDKKNTQRTYNNSYHYNRQKKQRYHDGSDGLVSIVRDKQLVDVHPTEMKELDSGVTKTGILEVMSEGYGFIRCDNFLPGDNDVYVASQFIRRFGLRTGDVIKGNLRINSQGEKFSALLYMEKGQRKITRRICIQENGLKI